MNCGSAGTALTGIALSSGKYTARPWIAKPLCRRSVDFQSPYTGSGSVLRQVPGETSSIGATGEWSSLPCQAVVSNQ